MVQKVRYRGNPSSVGVLDSLLRNEGLRVEHREIVERPGFQQDIVDVVLYVDDPDANNALGTSSEALITPKINRAITKLRASVPRAQAQIVVTHNNRSPHASLTT
jgi:hypothetical protein